MPSGGRDSDVLVLGRGVAELHEGYGSDERMVDVVASSMTRRDRMGGIQIVVNQH